MPRPRPQIINDRDRLPVTVFSLFFVLQLLLFVFVSNLWLLAAATALLLPFQASSSAFNHNQHHRLTFRSRSLNRGFEYLLFWQTGTSPYAWRLHHVVGHHQHFLDQELDTSRWMKSDGSSMSRLRYNVQNAIMIYPNCLRMGWSQPRLLRPFLGHLAVCSASLALLLMIHPARALILFVIPMVIMQLVLVDATHEQHAGLDTSDHFTATNNKLNTLYNRFTWNLGYHTAHHLRPGVHWSKLPELHDTIVGQIPTELIHDTWGPDKAIRKAVGRA